MKRSIAEAASELKRELGVRRRCYRRWVDDGKLTDVEAVDRMERMEAALDIVERAALLASVPPLTRPAHIPDASTDADTVAALLAAQHLADSHRVTSSGDKTEHDTL